MIPNECAIASALIRWQKKQGRHNLPWQYQSPYHVWLSEIMLQQTQVKTVIPYYEKFIKRFPSVEILAQAPLEIVLQHWAGLGYYSRAKNLHKSAQIIVNEYQGILPSTLDGLEKLPGIGRSTAGAIRSLGYKLPAAILDGNVKRILARVYHIDTPLNEPKTIKHLWEYAQNLAPENDNDIYTQATMDLGAMICKRKNPQCISCPIKPYCESYLNKTTDCIPVANRKIKKKDKNYYLNFVFSTCRTLVLMHQRPINGIWGGLYCPLLFETEAESKQWLKHNPINCDTLQPIPSIKHQLTHKTLHLHIQTMQLDKNSNIELESNYQWLRIADSHALPAPIQSILEQINERCKPNLLP